MRGMTPNDSMRDWLQLASKAPVIATRRSAGAIAGKK